MIRRLTGTIAHTNGSTVVVDVNGVGYLVHTTPAEHWDSAAEVTIWTHLAVRENALDLYGFSSPLDLTLFEQLLSIPKIGPKSALQILSQTDRTSIHKAVIENDAGYLHKVSGIGKKTAEKIVLGLRDVLEDDVLNGSSDTTASEHRLTADVVDALIALGYPPVDARGAAQKIPANITTVNDAIRAALQILGQI